MTTEDEYGERAKRLLRSEMVRRGVSYEALSEKLGIMGLPDTPVNLRNKVSRGKFTAAFLMAACDAMECRSLVLRDEVVPTGSAATHIVDSGHNHPNANR